ncbi:MAG TPA: AsmA family protein, partial [Verrucomicrobiota bacterium]|nr:AsmA family protein [Verrucomicrobiota bacterium]
GVVLPRAGAALGADIAADGVSIRPFSEVILRGLKVQPRGEETVLAAAELRARYNLVSILRGLIKVDEIALVQPVVRVAMRPDGTSNLDAFTGGSGTPEPASATPGSPLKVDVRMISIDDATVHFTQARKDGSATSVELAGLDAKASGIRNGSPAKLDLDGRIQLVQRTGTNQAEVAGTLRSAFSIDVGSDLMPGQITGSADLAVTRATGAFADASELQGRLSADLNSSEIKQLAIAFTKGGAALGTASVSGPFDPLEQEGKLKAKVTGIGSELLSLVGGRFGISFGGTKLAADYDIELKDNAQFVSATGSITANSFSVERAGLRTPTVDFKLGCDATLDLPRTNATIRAFTLDATQSGRPLLTGKLTKEMLLDWSQGAQGAAESALRLNVTELNLADWKPFVGDSVESGMVSGQLDIGVQKAGRLVGFDLESKLVGLTGRLGSNRLDQANLTVGLRGQLAEFDRVDISALALDVSQRGRAVSALKGSGSYLNSTSDANFQAELTASLAALSELLGRTDLSLTAGNATFTGKVSQKNLAPAQTGQPNLDRSLIGKLEIVGLSGLLASNRLDRFDLSSDVDASMKNNLTEIRKCVGSIRQADTPAGTFNLTGRYGLTNGSGQIALEFTGLNQNALRPFVAEALGDKTLASLAVNGQLDGGYDPAGDSRIRGGVQITNLVVNIPGSALASTPLEARLTLDTVVRTNVAELREMQLTLTPTARAANRIQATGRVDFTQTNAATGHLTIMADALDATRYYEMLFEETAPSASGESAGGRPDSSSAADQDLEAMTLPLRNFIVDANVGRFYLREVEITNLVARARLDGQAIEVKPFDLALNGGPVSATAIVDLGVPGYRYDVGFKGTNVPVAPLVNSFLPEQKGQFSGTGAGFGQCQGAGTTEASLAKSLTGQFELSTTNLNLAIASVDNPMLKALVNVVVGIPDFVRNPSSGVAALVGQLTGTARQGGGVVDEMTQAPIDQIIVKGAAGNGRLEVQQGYVQSGAFHANAAGTIALQAPLTNSTMRLPVQIALRRSLADRIGLAGDTPTNAPFAKLPDFVTLKGTVGAPESDISRTALVAMAAKAGAGILDRTGSPKVDQAAGILGAVGNLIGGGDKAASGTNAPAAGQSGANLLGTLNTLLGGGAQAPSAAGTNTTTTNAPATAPRDPLGNVLDLLRKR